MSAISEVTPLFSTREEAGVRLAEEIQQLGLTDPLILAIPRGALPVAKAISEALGADLDIAPGPERQSAQTTEFAPVTADCRFDQMGFAPANREIVVVDDGIITGAAAVSVVENLQKHGAARIVVVTPVVTESAQERLRDAEIELICLERVEAIQSVSDFFHEAETVTDAEVEKVREHAKSRPSASKPSASAVPHKVDVQLDGGMVSGGLAVPRDARGAVIFVDDGAPSAWLLRVAQGINEKGIATLLLHIRDTESNTEKLSSQLRQAVDWLGESSETTGLAVGFVACGNAGAAALRAAVSKPERIRCVVTVETDARDAEDVLEFLHAPVLSIVGEEDETLVENVRETMRLINSEKALVLLPGVAETIDTEEAEEEVVRVTTAWFERFLVSKNSVRHVHQTAANWTI